MNQLKNFSSAILLDKSTVLPYIGTLFGLLNLTEKTNWVFEDVFNTTFIYGPGMIDERFLFMQNEKHTQLITLVEEDPTILQNPTFSEIKEEFKKVVEQYIKDKSKNITLTEDALKSNLFTESLQKVLLLKNKPKQKIDIDDAAILLEEKMSIFKEMYEDVIVVNNSTLLFLLKRGKVDMRHENDFGEFKAKIYSHLNNFSNNIKISELQYEEFRSFGTPTELKYLKHNRCIITKDNKKNMFVFKYKNNVYADLALCQKDLENSNYSVKFTNRKRFYPLYNAYVVKI